MTVNGASSSNLSSLHNSANIISGLASGLDTEGMIEGMVQSYTQKIESIQKQVTKTEWQQEAYRSIISKMVDFTDKYTSYTSSTNLLDSSFFTNSTNVEPQGKYADYVTASGKSSSEILINEVKQLASSARWVTSGNFNSQGNDTTPIDSSKTLGELGFTLDGQDLKASGTDDKGANKYVFTINGAEIGSYSVNTSLSTILSDINRSDVGMKVSFSKLTNNFVFTSKETGKDQEIKIREGEFSALLFGSTATDVGDLYSDSDLERIGYTKGSDAKFSVSVNGSDPIPLTRSSNTVDLDGLTVTLKKKFPAASDDDAISFDVSTDADPIVDAIKSMVNDYNTLMTEIKKNYTTAPLKTSKGTRYEPLSEKDAQDMSESAIEKYEEKAKQGLLFCDSDLTALHDSLLPIFTPGGKDSALLEKMGITISSSSTDNSTSVTVDETKLRAMLDSDPEAVSKVFAGSSSDGSDGIMSKLKNRMDVYARTTGATKGILVQKAGTPSSALSMLNNTLQTKINDYNTEIEKWQDKLSTKIDYYTKQFSRLESLISQMNSQSSALAGMMGGY